MINGRELQGQMKQIAFFALTMAYSLMVLQRELPSGRFSQNNKYSGGLFFFSCFVFGGATQKNKSVVNIL